MQDLPELDKYHKREDDYVGQMELHTKLQYIIFYTGYTFII